MKYLLLLIIPLYAHAGWVVAPDGNATDRPLKYIPRDANIPSRAPVGYPCESNVIKQIGKTNTAWVYMRDGYDLAAVCVQDEPAPVEPVPTPDMLTFNHAYDVAKVPAGAVNIVSYIQPLNGTLIRSVVPITGCDKYQVPQAASYRYYARYIDSGGQEGDATATVTIVPDTNKQPQC